MNAQESKLYIKRIDQKKKEKKNRSKIINTYIIYFTI